MGKILSISCKTKTNAQIPYLQQRVITQVIIMIVFIVYEYDIYAHQRIICHECHVWLSLYERKRLSDTAL